MQNNPTTPVLPHEVHNEIVNFFLEKMSDEKVLAMDTFGITPMEDLTGLLLRLGSPSECWDKLANFILEKTHGRNLYVFTSAIKKIHPKVSKTMLEKIVRYMARRGEIDSVVSITQESFGRLPSRSEIESMIKYHRNQSSSTDQIWFFLEDLALSLDSDSSAVIKSLITEARNSGFDDDIPF